MAHTILDQMEFTLLQRQNRTEQEQEQLDQETKDLETLLKTFTEENENQKNQNSSLDNNVFPKRVKHRSDYSNSKVKARNLLTNVAYRRFKQSDFIKDSFVIDLLSFFVQNCNPINLEIKLETEKERDMVKCMWDVCIPHEFVNFMLKHKSYNIISQPNLTYQKSKVIVKNCLLEDGNRINHLKYKMAEKFNLVHYIYSFLYAKIYNRTNIFGIERKSDFDFQFQMWRKEKQQKFIAKEPANYVNRNVEKEEQVPLVDEDKIKNKKKLNKKRKILEEKLEENNEAMRKIKMKKNDIF